MPCSAMQKLMPRYGCWFWCGWPPPALGWIMPGANEVLSAPAGRKAVADEDEATDSALPADGDEARLAALFWA